MYPLGLIIFLQFLWEDELLSFLVLVALGLSLSVVFLCHCNHQRHQDAPPTLSSFPLLNILYFLKKPHDFFSLGFGVTNQRLFQFRFLRVRQTLANPVAVVASTFR